MQNRGFAAILQKIDEKQTAKLAAKLPSWAACGAVHLPTSLAFEQCSSEATALHKASVIAGTTDSNSRIADLTGGLGVDCWAFSRVFGRVLHNEVNAELSEAVRQNFKTLGVDNAEFSCEEVSAESLESGIIGRTLEEFAPDVIFLDPARRSKTGGKVFLPEDCSPDITAILPRLLELAPTVTAKLSPVMDTTLLARRIPQIREIHVVGTSGECKELLCIIGRSSNENYRIIAEELNADGSVAARHIRTESRSLAASKTVESVSELIPGRILYVPSATALKADCHPHIASEAGLKKLGRFTHIYVGSDCPESAFFKRYTILEALPLNKAGIRQIAEKFPSADVTARNIPISSDKLREKIYGKKPARGGTQQHIFGVDTDACGKVLIVTTAL